MKKPPLQTVSEWLETATKRLSAPAKERIAVEIEAHYSEAVNNLMAGGMPKPEAHFAALSELGDPRDAGKSFRQRHLTENEAGSVKAIQLEAYRKRPLSLKYAMFTLMVFPRMWEARMAFAVDLVLIVAFVVLVAMPTVSFVISRRHETNSKVRFLVLLNSISGYGPAMAFSFVCVPNLTGTAVPWRWVAGDTFDYVFLFAVFLWSLGTIRLWRKLKSVSEPWNQLTPADVAPAPSIIDFIRGR
jgi:hypothetical protein